MLTLHYMPNASSVLHLHPTLVPLVFPPLYRFLSSSKLKALKQTVLHCSVVLLASFQGLPFFFGMGEGLIPVS